MKFFRYILWAWLSSLAPLSAAELGDDGLHKQDWFFDSFFELFDDLNTAKEEDKI